ncbi:radical SAM domain-containing protein [Vibrio phage D479]
MSYCSSPTCIAPFTSPAITPDGFKICSHPGQPSYPDLSFWNSDELVEMRRQISRGEIPDSCRECRSTREGVLVGIPPKDVDYVPVNFKYLYLARSNKCDLACEMCSSTISHSYDKKYNDGKCGIIENDFDLSPYLPDTTHVAISGGNPVLDKKVLEIIDALEPSKVEHFIFTSNGSVFPDSFVDAIADKEWGCNPTLIFSIDGPKAINEVVRFGAKQERIYKTIDETMNKVRGRNVDVMLEYTATNKTVTSLVEFYQEAIFSLSPENLENVGFFLNECGSPANLSLANITSSQYDHLVNVSIPYFHAQRTKLARMILGGLMKIVREVQFNIII